VEVDNERLGFAPSPSHHQQSTLGDLIRRYRDTVVIGHRSQPNETAKAVIRPETAQWLLCAKSGHSAN
jgi:hypothetical protein